MGLKFQASGPGMVPNGGIAANHSTQKFPLGHKIWDKYGNTFRYVKASEALVLGDAVTATARAAFDTTIVVDGAVSSGQILHVDTPTTAVDANAYAGGYVSQATAAGEGIAYQIEHHAALPLSGEVDLHLVDEIDETFDDGATLYFFDPYRVEKVDADTEPIMGVAVGAISSGYYGFVQVGGFCKAVRIGHSTSAAIVLNEPLLPVAANPGAVQGFAGTGEPDIVEAAVTKLIALQAVGANTTGYAGCYIKSSD